MTRIARILAPSVALSLAAALAAPDGAGPDARKLTTSAAARLAAGGRGQELPPLTAEGLPDGSVGYVAVGGTPVAAAALNPAIASATPTHVADAAPRPPPGTPGPVFPPDGAKWGAETQADVKCPFKTPRFECIPFLPRGLEIDGKLNDWGRIRPLVLRPPAGDDPLLLYAAWNYRGLFFGYHVRQGQDRFRRPDGKAGAPRPFAGDYLRVLLDPLNARPTVRGDRYVQEFVIFPDGTTTGPAVPGLERIIISHRSRGPVYRPVEVRYRAFDNQPLAERGPDRTGPYRAARIGKDAYTCEAFLPRELLRPAVLHPGWHVGFECVIGTAGGGQAWAGKETSPDKLHRPRQWGDLLLLGTDPRITVRNSTPKGGPARCVAVGHSYLLTVADPDRNLRADRADRVLVGATAVTPRPDGVRRITDVEALVLVETGKDTGVFRGYVNTRAAAGEGRPGVLDVAPGQQAAFGYVDLADSAGRRDRISTCILPVVPAPAEKGRSVRGGPR